MKRLIAVITAIASLTTGTALIIIRDGSAQTAQIPCVGPPAEYIAENDDNLGQPVDGAVTYPYATAYIEYQGWLTKNDGVTMLGANSEHIHLGGCLPLGQTLNDNNASPWYFDGWYRFHNVNNYTVTAAAMAVVSQIGSQGVFTANATQLADLNAAMQLSSGMHTTSVFQSYTSAAPPSNGIKELRWNFNTVRSNSLALVDEWRVNGRSYVTYDFAGKTTVAALGAPTCNIDFVRTQNWVKFINEAGQVRQPYGYAGFGDSHLAADGDCIHPAKFTPAALAAPRPDNWETSYRVTDGVPKGEVFVNPNFHVDPETFKWMLDMPQPIPQNTTIPVTVPLGSLDLPSGIHRFMVRGHKIATPPSIQPIGTSIVVMPFKYGDTTGCP